MYRYCCPGGGSIWLGTLDLVWELGGDVVGEFVGMWLEKFGGGALWAPDCGAAKDLGGALAALMALYNS